MAKRAPVPVSELPVMAACCKTCPFRENEEGHWQNPSLAAAVISRNLFRSQQICHGTEGPNREPHNRCKGHFDHAFRIYQRIGLEPEKHLIF